MTQQQRHFLSIALTWFAAMAGAWIIARNDHMLIAGIIAVLSTSMAAYLLVKGPRVTAAK